MNVGFSPRRGTFALYCRAAALAMLVAASGCTAALSDMASSPLGVFSRAPAGAPQSVPLFVASTRKDNGRGGEIGGEGGAQFSLALVSVPPTHSPGVIEAPAIGGRSPASHFVLTSNRRLTAASFANELSSHISGRVGSARDVLLYVHGFNTSLQEARFRLAQIVADAHFGGVPVLFTWPSQSNLFSYISDKDQASISRDALERLMRDLGATPGVGRVHILAHSMGAWLAMEALRENAISGQASLGGKLGDVMLASPDIDLGVFRQQMARLGSAGRVSVFVSRDDRALGLSGRLAGQRLRVGALDPTKPGDLAALKELGVTVYDVSALSQGLIGHSIYADAPVVIQAIGAQLAEPRKEDAATVAGVEKLDEPLDAAAMPTSMNAPPASTGAIVGAPLDAPEVAGR